MNVFLFLFVSLILAIPNDQCICEQGENKCIPSISALGSTVNLFTNKETQYGLHAIEFTCSGKTFYDDIIEKTFLVYDQMLVQGVPFGSISAESYTTSESLAKSMSTEVNAGGEYKWFKGSIDVQSIDKQLMTQNEFYLSTRQMMNIYEYNLRLPLKLQKPSEDFQAVVDGYLTDEYDEKVYFDVIENILGTHVIVDTIVGGKGSLKTEVNYNYYQHESEFSLKADAKIYFVNLQAGHTQNETTESWKNNTKTTSEVLGGDPQFAQFENWDKWLPTVRKQPVQMLFKVGQVTDLIRDSKKKANYERAIATYSGTYNLTKVPNCTHYVIASSAPKNTLRTISPWDPQPAGKIHKYNVYLVQGANENGYCLAGLQMRMNQKKPSQDENDYLMKGIIYNKDVIISGESVTYEGTPKIKIQTNFGYCEGESTAKCNVEAKINTITSFEQMHFEITGCPHLCWFRGIGAIWQKETIDHPI